MLPTTILIDNAPRCVVRPVDTKDLNRFIRNARSYLLGGRDEGSLGHRSASDAELARWRDGLNLHKAWGGADEDFFGVPL